MQPKPSVVLTEDELLQLCYQVEGLVDEALTDKANREGKDEPGSTEIGPAMVALIAALNRNYIN